MPRNMSDTDALDHMTDFLSSIDWDSSTIEEIARLIQETGRVIEDTPSVRDYPGFGR